MEIRIARNEMRKTSRLSLIAVLAFLLSSCGGYHRPDSETENTPKIFPDYANVTFPVNIAPPNFRVEEKGDAFQVEIGIPAEEDSRMVLQASDSIIRIPESKWKKLLVQAADKDIYFRISIRNEGKWTRYADIQNHISPDSIDAYLAYRLLYPGYEIWSEIGIYQRDLSSYTETAIVENRDFENQCVNCHTFAKNSPETMMMHIRGKQGGTLISRHGNVEKVDPNPGTFSNGATYAAWHPSGKYIAFSNNDVLQNFHTSGTKTIEVSDKSSDLTIYNVEAHRSFTDSLIYGKKFMETFPTWSPDGKTLYFCRAKAWHEEMPWDSIRYDLCRIQFDEQNEDFHDLECIYEASAQGKSVSFPRVSPDGRYLVFVLSDYGNFSIWHPEAELYLLDLQTGSARNLQELNSDHVESFHTWSSTGRWMVFSSKRIDGLWARPYFAHFDTAAGRFSKPFLLPQKDPNFYEGFLFTYNLPELIKEPVKNGKRFLEALEMPKRIATGK